MTESERRSRFNELYAQFEKRVFAYCLYVTGDRDQTNDVFQEVFIKVYRGLKHFQARSEFSTWLHRIAVNVCLTHRSRSRSGTHVRLGENIEGEIDETHPALGSRSAGDPPDEYAVRVEMGDRVEQALAELSPKQRMVREATRKLENPPAIYGHNAGIGVKSYAWSTSPLRRYTDLVTHRLLKACLDGSSAPYSYEELVDLVHQARAGSATPAMLQR